MNSGREQWLKFLDYVIKKYGTHAGTRSIMMSVAKMYKVKAEKMVKSGNSKDVYKKARELVDKDSAANYKKNVIKAEKDRKSGSKMKSKSKTKTKRKSKKT